MKSISALTALAFITVALAAPAPIVAVDGTYQQTVLKHHNAHRANHSVPALQWGPYMAAWALTLAERCTFSHNTSIGFKPYGQNIAAGTAPHDISYIISNEFYNSEMPNYADFYGLDNPNFTNFTHFGHFTQLVWEGTTHVGCATVNCSATGIQGLQGLPISPWMTVCNYWPGGNWGGEYGINVKKPLGQPTIDGSY